ncbi:MAG: response regulator [Armatimonadota bacterium]|nr:response regulator [Armatimonadota bacterium]
MSVNVLVVDDSSVMRSIIVKTLRISGLPIGHIYQASNGREGLDVLKDHWIDIALVDINMPEMNGIEMIEAVRKSEDTAELPILVVSTESSETTINELWAKGVEFVHKPFAPEVLREAVIRMTGVRTDDGCESGTPSDSDDSF